MKTKVVLDEKDVIQTIANAFDVDAKAVTLKIEEVWRGYAQGEYKSQAVTAEVTLKNGGAADG